MRKLIITAPVLLFFMGNVFAQDPAVLLNTIPKNQTIKVEFFSPLFKHLTVAYERHFKNVISFEGKLGMIGVGAVPVNKHNLKGAFLNFGPKFYFGSDFNESRPLKGSYFKPELILTAFSYDTQDYGYYYQPISYNTNIQNISGAFLLTLGNQMMLTDFFTMDFHMGIGYDISDVQVKRDVILPYIDRSYSVPFKFSHVAGDKYFPIAFNCGFAIGVLFR